MSRVYDRLDGVLGVEVDQREGAQAVVGLNMARDDVDGRLSASPAERPGDVRPFGRGVFWQRERERERFQPHTHPEPLALGVHVMQLGPLDLGPWSLLTAACVAPIAAGSWNTQGAAQQ